MLFSEELGLILEVPYSESTNVLAEYSSQNVPCFLIGHSCKSSIPSESMVKDEISPVLIDKHLYMYMWFRYST